MATNLIDPPIKHTKLYPINVFTKVKNAFSRLALLDGITCTGFFEKENIDGKSLAAALKLMPYSVKAIRDRVNINDEEAGKHIDALHTICSVLVEHGLIHEDYEHRVYFSQLSEKEHRIIHETAAMLVENVVESGALLDFFNTGMKKHQEVDERMILRDIRNGAPSLSLCSAAQEAWRTDDDKLGQKLSKLATVIADLYQVRQKMIQRGNGEKNSSDPSKLPLPNMHEIERSIRNGKPLKDILQEYKDQPASVKKLIREAAFAAEKSKPEYLSSEKI
jgi:hypothetical protein